MTSFLAALGFSQFVTKIGELSARLSFSEAPSEAKAVPKSAQEEEMIVNDSKSNELNNLQLPRIVVVGDENSGKSSTLERLAMVAVFPRAATFSTKQPIVLKLRHDVRFTPDKPKFLLEIPGKPAFPKDLTCEQVQGHITARMNEITEGVVFDSEIVVHVFSSGVPTIDLVDLPGLIQVQVNQSGSLAEQTEACTRQYLNDEKTGAVVCVLDATMDNIRVSKALRMVQDAPVELKRFAVGVFTKADRSFDNFWEEHENATGPYWRLRERLLNVADDSFDIFGGYVALRNRNTRNKNEATKPLSWHATKEMQFFRQSQLGAPFTLPDPESDDVILSEVGKLSLGLQALIQKIDIMICRHLDRVWAPEKKQKILDKRRETVDKINALGLAPSELKNARLYDHVLQLMEPKCQPAQLNAWCESLQTSVWDVLVPQSLLTAASDAKTPYERVEVTRQLRIAIGGPTANSKSVLTELETRLVQILTESFNADTSGDVQLHRFPALLTKCIDEVKTNLQLNVAAFQKTTQRKLNLILDTTVGGVVPVVTLRNAFADCIMECLIFPLLDGSHASWETTSANEETDAPAPPNLIKGKKLPFLWRAVNAFPDCPPDANDSLRRKYLRMLADLDTILKTLEELGTRSTNVNASLVSEKEPEQKEKEKEPEQKSQSAA